MGVKRRVIPVSRMAILYPPHAAGLLAVFGTLFGVGYFYKMQFDGLVRKELPEECKNPTLHFKKLDLLALQKAIQKE
eukprot:NODE_3210_length_476_cov_107.063232_g2789_i0.p1 GENE.NODE_3210_length_476_cov_107.063232_g2789_i0~~NODE_3210_length_476_cov_107.063232_g2789_i0.p1  ORF type:complete len:87 (+),score=29.51 NODE_3210_length_476_cov_107.063232_g2789_i0:32-262(+)